MSGAEGPLFPAFLRLSGKRVVVVGGGEVGARRAEALVRAGAKVTVIDPEPGDLPGGVTLRSRPYAPGDLEGAALAFSATGDPAVTQAVAHEAAERGIWFNAADDPRQCTFQVPALLDRGALQIAVSTGGASPLLAAGVRDLIGVELGPEWAGVIGLLGELRDRWTPRAREAGLPVPARKRAWEGVLALPLAELARGGKLDEARRRAEEILEKALRSGNRPEGTPG